MSFLKSTTTFQSMSRSKKPYYSLQANLLVRKGKAFSTAQKPADLIEMDGLCLLVAWLAHYHCLDFETMWRAVVTHKDKCVRQQIHTFLFVPLPGRKFCAEGTKFGWRGCLTTKCGSFFSTSVHWPSRGSNVERYHFACR